MSDTLKFLQKEVKRAKGIESGTVVTFDRFINKRWNHMRQEAELLPDGEGKNFTYAAIFVGGRWFFTGAGRLGNSQMTTREFLERIAEEDISNIRLATEFANVSEEEYFDTL